MDDTAPSLQLNKETGARLRQLRLLKGLTQQELVDDLGDEGVRISRTYLSEVERTGRIPSGRFLPAAANLLGTTTDYILLISDERDPGPSVPDVFFSSEANRIAAMVDEMSPEWRQSAYGIIERLLLVSRKEQSLLTREGSVAKLIEHLIEEQGDDTAVDELNILRGGVDSQSGTQHKLSPNDVS